VAMSGINGSIFLIGFILFYTTMIHFNNLT